MLSTEFARNYDAEESVRTIFPEAIQSGLDDCRIWSMRIGSLLHTRLTGNPLPGNFDQIALKYRDWLDSDFIDINTRVLNDKTDAGLHASSEINFHRLNGSVFNNWGFALGPGAEDNIPPTRTQLLKLTQYRLACAGINYCSQRAQTAEIASDYQYLQAGSERMRVHNEALMTEYDAGAVLLGLAQRHRGMTAVPAPAQFEHSRRKRHNVDWIVIDHKNNRTTGVQVKTHVRAVTREEYDAGILLLDSDHDIGNGIFHRDTPGTTRERRYVWGGLICAQVVLSSTLAQQAKEMRKLGPLGIGNQSLLFNRQLAVRVIGNQRIRLADSVKVVDEKLTEHL